MQWMPHLSFVPFNSHLKEKADANLEQRPHLAEVRCFASISNPSQRPGRVLPWCGVSCWSFYINLWYCLEILLCLVFLLFFIWVCPVTMHCEQWGWTDHCFAQQHFDSYFKNCFLWKFPCFELKRCCLPTLITVHFKFWLKCGGGGGQRQMRRFWEFLCIPLVSIWFPLISYTHKLTNINLICSTFMYLFSGGAEPKLFICRVW